MTEESRNPHINALPSYQKAIIPPEKLEKYLLNPKHTAHVWGKSSGKDKALVFKSALGFDQSNWELLRDRILEELPYHEALVGEEDQYGKRYNVTLPIEGANGNIVNVLTAWIIRPKEDSPRFVTARCLKP
ncbi:MAG: hypothetical protein H7Y30_05200 [Pyrinomonadaceae bacterium]|nr:hypothetical protein [Pyrinomonadaceae bacterium]